MRLISRLTAIFLIATAVASAPTRARAQSLAGEAAVHHWLDDFKRAFEARDAKAIMALYTQDVIAYDVIPPLQYTGSEAYAKDWQTFFAGYKGPMTLEFRDVHIYTSGDLALVTCLERSSGTLTNGQTSSIWLRDTTALRRVNGRWLDFHDHVSVPADPETSKALFDLHP